MTPFYFIYKRIGKRQVLYLWRIIEDEDKEKATEQGSRQLFIGDFKYEWIDTIEIKTRTP